MAEELLYRLVDNAGSEIGLISWAEEEVAIGDTVRLPDGRDAEVLDVYDDEYGRDGGVEATLVVDDE